MGSHAPPPQALMIEVQPLEAWTPAGSLALQMSSKWVLGAANQLSAGKAMSCCSCAVSEGSLEHPRFIPPAPDEIDAEIEDEPPALVAPPALAPPPALVEEVAVEEAVDAGSEQATATP